MENMFGSQFFTVLKKHRKYYELFSENTKIVFFVYSKTVLKSNFQKQELNRSLAI